jgi:hypothetical protein
MNSKSKGEILLYKTPEGETEIDVKLEEETVWLSQKLMAKLFLKNTDTIGLHISNIFKEGELEENSTTEYYSVVQREGKRNILHKIKYYNLDVIISVGYWVKSKRGIQFRIWLTRY